MKKYSLILIAALSFAACNSEVKTDDDNTQKETVATDAGANPKLAANMDPVCNMEKDNTWTEYVAANGDTTWFCSPHCKETFEKNPEKYSSAAQETK